jgi:CubicO group peptidase (beta-lactamase class C family)
MVGITGFSNLYTDTNDLSIFAQMMLQRGYYSGRQYISAKIIDGFTSSQLPDSYTGLGWQNKISEVNISSELPNNAFGFNSPSGSFIWIDPENKIFIVFLTDALNENNTSLIPEIQKAVYKIIKTK